jgi:hypothetical protein
MIFDIEKTKVNKYIKLHFDGYYAVGCGNMLSDDFLLPVVGDVPPNYLDHS